MQMYKGLPIITNKIPDSERNGIPHHLLDFIDLRERPWSVQHFVKRSSCIIDEIRARGKLPIVVGGTIYYTFSLLFNDAILSSVDEVGSNSQSSAIGGPQATFPILTAPTDEMLAKLNEVDPEMARRWHPNDRSKIQNSLRIFLQSGRKASEIYAEQRRSLQDNDDGAAVDVSWANPNGSSLRFPSLLLWLEAEDALLKQRLNDRVDAMVADGLCNEVVEMADLESKLTQEGDPTDLTNGIWASIGYKEMKPWLEAQQTADIDLSKIDSAKRDGIEAVKASTRRYAKRQNRFVRIRLAKALRDARYSDLLFLLDCTDLTRWSSAVGDPAEKLVSGFLQGDELPKAKGLSTLAAEMFSHIEAETTVADREARVCQVCQKTLMNEKEWTGHLASRSHKKLVTWHRRQQSALETETERNPAFRLSTPPG